LFRSDPSGCSGYVTEIVALVDVLQMNRYMDEMETFGNLPDALA
jgi:hypothetical protein